MRIVKFFLLALMLISATAYSQAIDKNTDIIACFDKSEAPSGEIDRLAELFKTELNRKYDDRPLSVKFNSAPDECLAGWIGTPDSRYFAVVRLITSDWQVKRAFTIPFALFVYRNSFWYEAFAQIYYQGNPVPVLKKTYKIKIGGPRAFQLFENNPNDGGLFVPHGERLQKQNEAEQKFMELFVDDLIQTLKKCKD